MSNPLSKRYLSATAKPPKLVKDGGRARLEVTSIRTGAVLWSSPWLPTTDENRAALEATAKRIAREQFIQNASRTGSFAVRR